MKRLFPLLLPALIAANLGASPLEEADKLLAAGKQDEAVELMRQEVKKDEADPYALYNLGLTLYRAGRYEEALNTFQSIDTTTNRDLQFKSSLQMGNVQFRLAQQLKKSGQSVGAALSMERALGYFETAVEIGGGKESANNRKAAIAQLEAILLGIAESAANNAERLGPLNRLPEEERLLREALQARERARELDPDNTQIPPLIAETTKRLVANLEKQGGQLAKEADEAKDAKTAQAKRQQAIAKYDDALQLDSKNQSLAKARDEQVKKMSGMLVDEAEKLAGPALEKPALKLDAKDQTNLEQAKAKLEEALALDAANTRAADLGQKVADKLEESHVTQGNDSLKAAETATAPQKKLDLVKNAATQFQKALDQNPTNQPAKDGLKKAEAQLPDLFAAAGQADLAKAQGMQTGEAPSPEKLSNPDLQKASDLLDKSVQNLDTALSLKAGDAGYQQSLERAQKLLDATNDEARKRNEAKNGSGPPKPSEGGQGESDAGDLGEGKMLPLSLSNTGSKRPVTESKFWNKKIRDW